MQVAVYKLQRSYKCPGINTIKEMHKICEKIKTILKDIWKQINGK